MPTGLGSNTVVFGNSSITTTALRGNVGIGTTGPTAQLHTTGTVRFAGFGAGTLVTDANGNVSVSSDARLKNINSNFTRGIDAIKNIQPINYKWKNETGYDTLNTYTGFSAQNIQAFIPEVVSTDSNGNLTLSDRAILATLVNAVKEQQGLIENLGVSYFTLNSPTLTINTNYNILTTGKIATNELNIANSKLIIDANGNLITTGNLIAENITVNALIKANKAIIKDLIIEKLTINKPASGDAVIGSGKVPQGQKKIFINNTNVTANSKIFITIRTSNSDFDTIAVSNVQDGIGFEASIKQININNDTDFDYWIIN